MIEMTKWATVHINSFNRKLEVYSVMSFRQILIKMKFKTPYCEIGE